MAITLDRRSFVLGAAATPFVGLAAPHVARAAGDDIVVASIMDISGFNAVIGRPKENALRLVIDETNANGGLLGRKIHLLEYDTQSSNQFYAQFGRQLVQAKPAVAFGAILSASREILRPILRRGNILYFYNMAYEGGLCDRNIVITGPTVAQSVGTLVPYLVKNFGKKIYILGPDYNFGQISEAWIRKFAADAGAEVVGSERFPLDASNFTPTVSKIQASGADIVIDSFVTPPQYAFYSQWASTGSKKVKLASQTFGNSGQHHLLPAAAIEGLVTCLDYYDELDTPENKAFVKSYHDKYGAQGYIGDLSIADVVGWKLWTAAVTKAKTTDRDAVLKALESDLEVDTPAGMHKLDARTHHCIFDMHVLEVTNGTLKQLELVRSVAPTEFAGRCDLLKNPNTNQQFLPKM